MNNKRIKDFIYLIERYRDRIYKLYVYRNSMKLDCIIYFERWRYL